MLPNVDIPEEALLIEIKSPQKLYTTRRCILDLSRIEYLYVNMSTLVAVHNHLVSC